MENRNVLIGAVSGLFILVAAAGGYYLGSHTGATKMAGSVYSGAGGTATVRQPANTSSIVSDLEARLSRKPDDPELLLTLADTLFNMKRFEEAFKYYKKLSMIKPDDVDAYNEMGLSLYYLGKSKEGLKYIDEGIKKNPYHQRIWLTKGFILAYGVGDLDAAGEAWKKAKAIDPSSRVGKAAADYLAQIKKADLRK